MQIDCDHLMHYCLCLGAVVKYHRIAVILLRAFYVSFEDEV